MLKGFVVCVFSHNNPDLNLIEENLAIKIMIKIIVNPAKESDEIVEFFIFTKIRLFLICCVIWEIYF